MPSTHLPRLRPAPFYSLACRVAIDSQMSTHVHHNRYHNHNQHNTLSELQLKLNAVLSRVVGEDAVCSSPSCLSALSASASASASSLPLSPPCPPSTPVSASSKSPASFQSNGSATSDTNDDDEEEEDYPEENEDDDEDDDEDDAVSNYGDEDDNLKDDEDEEGDYASVTKAHQGTKRATPSAYAALAALNPYEIEIEDFSKHLSLLCPSPSSSPSRSSSSLRHLPPAPTASLSQPSSSTSSHDERADRHARDAARLARQFENARADVEAEKRVAMRVLRKQVRRIE